MSVSQRLSELGLTLPPVASPLAAYVPATRVGAEVWTSGQLPLVGGRLETTGKLGENVDLPTGVALAHTCALNALAAAASVAGGVDHISRVLKVVVFVASTPDFTAQPQVANGASELFSTLFGDGGVHVRSAVGVAVLPLDAPVELELVVELTS